MLKELKTQHRNIIQMVFSGFSNNEIAARLEMSHVTVSQIIRSPLGQAYLGGLNDKAQEDTLDVRKKLTSLNKDALKTFERILDPRQKAPHSVQATVAKDILDRNGYKPPDRLNIDLTMAAKTDAEIDAEINALESSINKASLQDPIKEISSDQTVKTIVSASIEKTRSKELEELEELEEDFFNIDDVELTNIEFVDSVTNFPLDEKLLSKVSANVFNSSKKVP